MVITRDVNSIIQDILITVEPCFSDAKGIKYGDHPGIEVTLDCLKPQNSANVLISCL